jgi:sterol desaturase/sphingolipid hydroxylase (fatty acid hydroxylase superfamily)
MQYEAQIRLAFFVGILLLLAGGEWIAPRRRLIVPRPLRWLSNLGLVGINNLVLRLVPFLGLVSVANFAAARQWGLLHLVDLPTWAGVLISLLALDLAMYLQHVVFHAVPMLWRLHMVHHADLDFDVTTGVRFHTIEVGISLLVKAAVVVSLGVPAVAVLVFEVMLNASSMFNHANLRLPQWLDRILRLFVVTPDMHRVHHSIVREETNSNFGFNLSWWDYLLGTYRRQPAAGHEQMTIGLSQFRDQRVDRLHWMLALPFLGAIGAYAFGATKKDDDKPTE